MRFFPPDAAAGAGEFFASDNFQRASISELKTLFETQVARWKQFLLKCLKVQPGHDLDNLLRPINVKEWESECIDEITQEFKIKEGEMTQDHLNQAASLLITRILETTTLIGINSIHCSYAIQLYPDNGDGYAFHDLCNLSTGAGRKANYQAKSDKTIKAAQYGFLTPKI